MVIENQIFSPENKTNLELDFNPEALSEVLPMFL